MKNFSIFSRKKFLHVLKMQEVMCDKFMHSIIGKEKWRKKNLSG